MDWTGARYADSPTVEVSTVVAAPATVVWPLISDIALMAELSTELQRVEWLDDASGPATGARFRGHSAHPSLGEWSTTCTVVACAPPTEFAWAVENPDNPTATWRFRLSPAGDGATELSQWVRMGPAPSGLTHAIQAMPDREQKIVFVRLREWERAMTANLVAIRARAEQG